MSTMCGTLYIHQKPKESTARKKRVVSLSNAVKKAMRSDKGPVGAMKEGGHSLFWRVQF